MSKEQQSNESLFAFLIILGAGFVLLYFVIQNNFHLLMYVWKAFRLALLAPVSLLVGWIPFFESLELREAVKFLWETPAVDIMRGTPSLFDRHLLATVAWIPAALMFVWGIKRIRRPGVFSRRFYVEQITKEMYKVYPELAHAANNSNVNKPIIYDRRNKDSLTSSMGIWPNQFARLNPPLGLEDEAKKNPLYRQPIWDGGTGFDYDLAERAFIVQLGERYTGIENLKPHERDLFDSLYKNLFVRLHERREMYTKIAKAIAKNRVKESALSVGEKALRSRLQPLIATYMKEKKKEKQAKKIKSVFSDDFINIYINNQEDDELQNIFRLIRAEQLMLGHSFTRVGLYQLLLTSRAGGRIPSHLFLRIKEIDRTLWWCLSSAGRRLPFTEAGGVFAHWEMEVRLGRPIPHPEVTKAVSGLLEALGIEEEM